MVFTAAIPMIMMIIMNVFFSSNIQPPFEQKKIYFKFTHEAESPGTLQRRIKLHENFYSCLVPPDTNAVQLRSSTQNNT